MSSVKQKHRDYCYKTLLSCNDETRHILSYLVFMQGGNDSLWSNILYLLHKLGVRPER